MGKIIITGAGRAGTTFLVQLLTRLGFDTGYEPYREPYGEAMRAGCEQRIDLDLSASPDEWRAALDAAPRILKSPEWGLVLKQFIQQGAVEVDHVFIPIRDLDDAAQSRIDAGLDWQVCETDDLAYKVMDQASVHALALGRAVEACFLYGIPHTLMEFPRLVEDESYCWRCLSEAAWHINREEFGSVFAELANPAQIKWTNKTASSES